MDLEFNFLNFKILKKSRISNARLGFIETTHGVIETPCLVPVATQAVVKTLTSEEVEQTGSQVLISNTFHLHLKPGEKIVEKVMKVPMGALFFRDYHNPPCFFGKVSIAIVKASFQTLKKARTDVKVSEK